MLILHRPHGSSGARPGSVLALPLTTEAGTAERASVPETVPSRTVTMTDAEAIQLES